MSLAEVRARAAALPPTLTTAETAEMLGTTTSTLWRLVREGTAPVEPLRLGRCLRFPTARVLAVLEIERPSLAVP